MRHQALGPLPSRNRGFSKKGDLLQAVVMPEKRPLGDTVLLD
jgi:hypothetical protein